MENYQQAKNNGFTQRKFVKQSAMTGGAMVLSGALPFSLFALDISAETNGIIEQQILSEDWKITSIESVKKLDKSFFFNINDGEWFSVPTMPAMPHKILHHHKKIEVLWKPFGMEKCFWVSQKDWVYSVNFKVENTSIESRLLFKELKGKVSVSLNGELLDNYFDQAHPLIVDVSGKLKPVNQLVLHFRKAAPEEKPDQPNPSFRKESGTNLGPNPMLYTSGVVGDIILEQTNGSFINEIITDFSLNNSLTKREVKFSVSGKSRQNNIKV